MFLRNLRRSGHKIINEFKSIDKLFEDFLNDVRRVRHED